MSLLIGYARVNTQKQELQLQMDALEKAACDKITNVRKRRLSNFKN